MTHSLRHRWLQRFRYRNMVRELQVLPPRELRALGIGLHDIPRLAALVAGL